MGDPGEGFAYDNERPRHSVDVVAFEIDLTPVTNGDFEEFVSDGGYERDELWTADGLRWRFSEGIQRPLYWTSTGGERRFQATEERDPDTARHARVVVRGRCLRALARRAPADRGRMGEGRRPRPGDGCVAPLPLGRRRGHRPSGQTSISWHFGPAPVGSLPARGAPPTACWG